MRAQLQPVTLEAVQAAIPEDAALLEFAVFRPFDPKAERNAEAYAPAHYAACVGSAKARRADRCRPRSSLDHRPPDRQDAGRLARSDDVEVKARARAVDERVMRPLRASLGGATRLLISPDGELNLVPFEALVDEGGRYLIERYTTTYLTSGRDLLRMQVPRAPRPRVRSSSPTRCSASPA